jgi:hypothetical protein
MKKEFIIAILFFGLISGGGFFASEASAATRTVDTTADIGALTACTGAAGDCSLRGAIGGAAAGDTINFDAALNGSTITVGSVISFSKALNIAGPGADKLTISGGNTTKIFVAVAFSGAANFSGLTFADGNGTGGGNGGQGGAVETNGITTATFDAVVFRNNNAATIGGALLCFASDCRISNSTFYSNSAPGASVFYGTIGSVQITNTTVTGNTETSSNYGALYVGGNVIIRNSTIADNPGRSNIYASTATVTLTLGNTIVAGSAGADIVHNGGTISTNGGNIIGRNNNAGPTFATAGQPNAGMDYVGTSGSQINPQLAPLTIANGGTTPTRALLPGSPALNHGNNCVLNNSCSPAMAAALTTDQRGAGFARQFGAANVDIGAFESQLAPTAANVSVSGRILTPDGTGLANARITLIDSLGNSRAIASSAFGYYRFEDITVGEIYVLTVASKSYQFNPQVVSVLDEISELNFFALQ